MQPVKHMAATAKETMGNMTAKVEEKMDKGKASATEKTDKAMAHDKVGKLEAKERKHEKEAEAENIKDQKKVDNAQEAAGMKQNVGTATGDMHHDSIGIDKVQDKMPPTETSMTNESFAHEATSTGAGAPAVPGGAPSFGY